MKRERVLIVDPNPLEGASLRSALCENGFDAVEASTADGALALVPSFQPAAVLVGAAFFISWSALSCWSGSFARGFCSRCLSAGSFS